MSKRWKPIHTLHIHHHAAKRAKERLNIAGSIDKVKDVLRIMLAQAILHGFDYLPSNYKGRNRYTNGYLYKNLVYIVRKDHNPSPLIPIVSLITVYPLYEEAQERE